MSQPPSYNREKDFTEDFGSETDHSALNAELDKASNSINDIRTNLAILQADDGKLNPNVITADSISAEVRAELSAGIVEAVGGSVAEAAASAAAAASSELNLANAVTVTTANKVAAAASEAAALASKNAAGSSAASALASKDATLAAETSVGNMTSAVAINKAATDANAASSLANKNAAQVAASVAVESASDAEASAIEAGNYKSDSQTSAAAALASKNAAAASAVAAQEAASQVDPSDIVHKSGNETLTGVKTFDQSPVVPVPAADNHAVNLGLAKWLVPVGSYIGIRDEIAGVEVPPKDNPAFRFIKLTASDAYNSGVLTGETVTGSAPLVSATAVVDLVGSPFHGKTERLLNTERRFLRAGSSGVIEAAGNESHTHTATQAAHGHGLITYAPNSGGGNAGAEVATVGGASANWVWQATPNLSTNAAQPAISVTSTGGNETRVKSIGITLYMRIK